MKRSIFLAVAAAAACLVSGAASAQSLPAGSYRESCRELYVEGKTLYGECQNDRGAWKKTWITGFANCVGEIVNYDGLLDYRAPTRRVTERAPATKRTPTPELAPTRRMDVAPAPAPTPAPTPKVEMRAAPTAAPARGLPGGDWTRTCRDAALDGQILRATCRDSRGTWRQTWLDLRQCRGDVANEDGLLVCKTPAAPAVVALRDVLPIGQWTASCRSAAVRQYQMRAECHDGRGQWLTTDLDLRTCKRGSVSVREGRLRCD